MKVELTNMLNEGLSQCVGSVYRVLVHAYNIREDKVAGGCVNKEVKR